MSSEQIFSTSDLRSAAQDSKRHAARKHKWHLGAVQVVGRGAGNPRPSKASETHYNANRRNTKGAVASLAHGTKMARKHDMLEGANETPYTSPDEVSLSEGDDNPSNHDDSFEHPSPPSPSDGVMFSFDAPRGPSEGSQILNAALKNAVQKFEEKETVKLVKDEYDVIDSEGESVGLATAKAKCKAKVREAPVLVSAVGDDEDYEFV